MTASPSSNGALTAFLRGVERRGLVFAELQSGDAARGDRALAATLQAFASSAGRAPFMEWPRRFWAMLLAAPDLRGASMPPLRDGPLAVLAGVGSGPRAAVLLRLVAGLSEGDAAAVLGISRSTYRMALHRALPRTGDGVLDKELWQAMGEAAQQAIRALPDARVQGASDPRAAQARPQPPVVASRRRGWVWPSTIAVVVLTAVALAATWWMPGLFLVDVSDAPRIVTEALPAGAEPRGRYGDEVALLTHRDLELLLDANATEPAPAEPAFDAWLVQALPAQEALDATP